MSAAMLRGNAAAIAAAVCRHNDAFRRRLTGGHLVLTAGVRALPPATLSEIVAQVRAFDAFDAANDPHGEHDFGSLLVADEHVFWKIDCYDRELCMHSPDPRDPAVTTRVLTIMLAEEY